MLKVIFICLALAVAGNIMASGSPATTPISGDYVEVRTASVFAGACHFNGEVGTTGRDAVMAWSLSSGVWKGTDLSGVKIAAVVSSEANLADAASSHRAEITVDSGASEAQASAAVDMLKSRLNSSLGKIVLVRRAPVFFQHRSGVYTVESRGFIQLSVEAMPNDLCCRMPNLVWYSPLTPLAQRKVGYTRRAYYAGGEAGETWERAGENSAFYGRFGA